jgi:hypothetical protein
MAQDSRSPTFPAVPVPTADVDGLYLTCMGLKEAVETMQGIRGETPSVRMYVQSTPPKITRDGDFWLVSGTLSSTLNVSLANKWFVVGTLV